MGGGKRSMSGGDEEHEWGGKRSMSGGRGGLISGQYEGEK